MCFPVLILLLVSSMEQPSQTPDIAAQHAAMKRLGFLVGEWTGTARIYRGEGEPLEIVQTEKAEYKLDGLILEIEGVGRRNPDGTFLLQALGMLSYDDARR